MAIVKRGNSYGVSVYRGGKHEWVGTRATRTAARQLETDEKAKKPTRGSETVAELESRYINDFNFGGDRWGKETKYNLRCALKPLVKRFGDERLSRFPEDEALPWASSQPASVVRAAKAFFNDAVDAKLISSNPLSSFRRKKSRGRADIIALTEEELHLLCDCAHEKVGKWFSTFLLFQGIQGLRPFACTAHILRSDVQGESLWVRRPGKKVAPRRVYLFPEVAQAITESPTSLSEFLFTTPNGSQLTANSVTHYWNKTRSVFESKLDPRRAGELRDARADGGEVDLYELRHGAATLMLRRGLTAKQVADQLGHTDGGTLVIQLYGHETDEDRMAGVRRSLGQPLADPVALEVGEASG